MNEEKMKLMGYEEDLLHDCKKLISEIKELRNLVAQNNKYLESFDKSHDYYSRLSYFSIYKSNYKVDKEFLLKLKNDFFQEYEKILSDYEYYLQRYIQRCAELREICNAVKENKYEGFDD